MNIGMRVLLWLCLSCIATPSFALGQIGHQIVCQLSFDLLTPANQQTVTRLLAQLSQQNKAIINQFTKQKPNQDISFANACTWADAIKKQDKYQAFRSWHFMNIDREQLIVNADTCRENCVTQAIKVHTQQLSQATSVEKQVMALMFLGHWLGDIHQPLHVSFASDLGGNNNKVTPAVGHCENLHWYWDECLLYPLHKPQENFDHHQFKNALYQKLKTMLAHAPQQQWRDSDISDWANESLQLIRDNAFLYCQLSAQKCLSNQAITVQITPAYHEKYQAILEQRILQAAVRLSDILNKNL